MVLPSLEVKLYEESMFSCTWLLQQTAAMLYRCVWLAWRYIKVQRRQKIGSCSAHAKMWLSGEAIVRATSEILGIWAAVKQRSEIKMMQCAFFYWDI